MGDGNESQQGKSAKAQDEKKPDGPETISREEATKQIAELYLLHKAGALTKEEFAMAKQSLLSALVNERSG